MVVFSEGELEYQAGSGIIQNIFTFSFNVSFSFFLFFLKMSLHFHVAQVIKKLKMENIIPLSQ